jgi:hypothetical protein
MSKLLFSVFLLAFASPSFAGDRCITLDAETETYLAAFASVRGETPERAWALIANPLPGRTKALAREAVMQALDERGAGAFLAVAEEGGEPSPTPRSR